MAAISGTARNLCGPGRAAFVVLAGGSGSRLGGERNKVYLPVAGKPMISWSLAWAAQTREVGPVVLVIRPQDDDVATEAIAAAGLDRAVAIVRGGATRHRSEEAALDHLAGAISAGDVDVVAIHDGARPLAGADLLRTAIHAAARHGGAVPTVPDDRAWLVDGKGHLRPPAAGTWLHRVQTPQAFRALPLLEAYSRARLSGIEGTDTAAALEGVSGLRVVRVPGLEANVKVTFAPDLALAERLLSSP
jgi:2-C-methyl-D-erythritol 4-phosphate cytidylyltransferase